MAGFLLVAGLTGALLAWNDELEAVFSPSLFLATAPLGDASVVPPSVVVDPLVMRESVLHANPGARAFYQPLRIEPGRSVMFFLTPGVDSSTGTAQALSENHVFVNPYTGAIQGRRNSNDLWADWSSLMPFIYRLHHTLALGTVGALAFGLVALLWTLDCVVGLFLTFPVHVRKPHEAARVQRRWTARWWPAWKVRWNGGGYKVNFDLHRAGSLWTWLMLLALAWSSVALSLPTVYEPVMRSVLDHQPDETAFLRLAQPNYAPQLDWYAARDIGRKLMQTQSTVHGFRILHEEWMFHDSSRNIYRYAVSSDLDVGDRYTRTLVYLDANTGALRGVWLPTGAAAGDTTKTWLTRLHMAAFNAPWFKWSLTGMGLLVALLCITGLKIWLKKRQARGKG